jgi:hypothetical protein
LSPGFEPVSLYLKANLLIKPVASNMPTDLCPQGLD